MDPTIDQSSFRDISWIMSRIDAKTVLERLDVGQIHESGTHLCTFCPDHEKFTGRTPSDPKWYLDKENGKTFCFTEGRGSNLVYTVARIKKLSLKEAASWIMNGECNFDSAKFDSLRVRFNRLSRNSRLDERKEVLAYETKIKEGKITENGIDFFMYPVGKKPTLITRDTVSHFGVVEIDDLFYKNRVVIPLYCKSMFAGFVAIDYLGEEKNKELFPNKPYKKVLYPKGMETSGCLFNCDDVIPKERLIITEGVREVMKLWQEGYKNSVALLGSKLSDKQKILIAEKCPKSIVVMLDGDDVGKRSALTIAQKLSGLFKVFVATPPNGYDPKNMDRIQLRSVLKNSSPVY